MKWYFYILWSFSVATSLYWMTACQVTCVMNVCLSVCHTNANEGALWGMKKHLFILLHEKGEVLSPCPVKFSISSYSCGTMPYFVFVKASPAKPQVDCHWGISVYNICKLFCWEDTVCKTSSMHTPTRSVLDREAVTLYSGAHILGECHVDSCCNLLLKYVIAVPCRTQNHG